MHERGRTTCLVADIGGTHARFALAELPAAGEAAARPSLTRGNIYLCSEFATPGAALKTYLDALPEADRPRLSVLGVAGVVTEDQVSLTNNDWSFSISALRDELRLTELHVVNDFAAIAWAVPGLVEAELEAVGSLPANGVGRDGVRVVLGPGTGLGLGAVIAAGGRFTVLDTEGGHIGFAPRDEQETYVLAFLAERYGRVSYERVLCGEGLLNVYQALCHWRGMSPRLVTPEAVSTAARDGSDTQALDAVRACWSMLGSYAGDAALMYGAWQGVYLAGGVVPHLLEVAGPDAFRIAFENKGRFAASLHKTPTVRIVRSDVGNFGAACYAQQLLQGGAA